MRGRNLAKKPLVNADTTCLLCGGVDAQYQIIRECRHKSNRDCRQKHIALLDIRRSHLCRTNILFKSYLDYATSLGEDKMSHTVAQRGLACFRRT